MSIGEYKVLSGEPEVSTTSARDIPVFVEDTYIRYVGQSALEQAESVMIDPTDIIAFIEYGGQFQQGLVVSFEGELFQALIGGTLGTPAANPASWKRVQFDTSQNGQIHQAAWDECIGPIIALRVLHSSLASMRTPLKGGKLTGSGSLDSGTVSQAAFNSRLTSIESRIELYQSRLERFVLKRQLTTWICHPRNGASCSGSTRKSNPMPFTIS